VSTLCTPGTYNLADLGRADNVRILPWAWGGSLTFAAVQALGAVPELAIRAMLLLGFGSSERCGPGSARKSSARHMLIWRYLRQGRRWVESARPFESTLFT
jgi:hypothetical protein